MTIGKNADPDYNQAFKFERAGQCEPVSSAIFPGIFISPIKITEKQYNGHRTTVTTLGLLSPKNNSRTGETYKNNRSAVTTVTVNRKTTVLYNRCLEAVGMPIATVYVEQPYTTLRLYEFPPGPVAWDADSADW